MKFLKFTLASPLQCWGEDARWDNRTTAMMPTKSAIIGLLGSCMGIPRGDDRLKQMCDKIKMAVRADQPGRIMTDFQTVKGTNGYFISAEGKTRSGGDTIITPKQYLQDARFVVFLWGDDSLLASCYQAMYHPVWPVYLGRKSCVPSIPIIPKWCEAESPEKVVATFTEMEQKLCKGHVAEVEMDMHENAVIGPHQRQGTRQDSIIRADWNEYSTRFVIRYHVKSKEEQYVLESH